MKNLTYFKLLRRLPLPVPPIVRRTVEDPKPLSEATKQKLIIAAVIRTKNWTS